VAFDTDMIGTYGYCSDISRTWLCGEVAPTPTQRELYSMAHQELNYNIELIKPGLSFQEYSEKAFAMPEKYKPLRYGVMAHGVGLCDEKPAILPFSSYAETGIDYNGELEPGMVLCVESYVGEVGGKEGVKLEDQILVTETGFENLTQYPFPLTEQLLQRQFHKTGSVPF
jgi:Xaa-Pro aminopeptidase